MTRKHTIVLASMAALLAAGTAVASEIYRYTDPDGNVHYVDRPTGAPSEERVPISSKPTNPAQVQARSQTRNSSDPAGDGADEESRPSREERAEAARERAEKCGKYRDQLETYVTSRRLYRETGGGEREYLDEKEILEARSKTEELVVKYCD